MAGPLSPPVLFARTNFCLLMSIFIPVIVFIREIPSAPPASAALAISLISVTFGVSFMTTGLSVASFISFVIFSTICGSVPNARAPCFTLGQLILISRKEMASSVSFLTTFKYSSSVCPQTLTPIVAPDFFKKGRSLARNLSTPGFSRPIALSIPEGVSAIRGDGLPSHGTSETPLVTTAPSLEISMKSEYSSPLPKVPLAVITGFLSLAKPRSAVISGFIR